MNKKIFASIVIVLCAVFSFTICLATDNNSGLKEATNDVRNFVGGVENTVEDAAKDVSNTSRDVTGDIENGLNNDSHKNYNNRTTSGSTDNNGRYTAARTSTDNNFMGMTSTAWTWLIVGIAAIAIIAVIWYYSMQFTNNNHRNDE